MSKPEDIINTSESTPDHPQPGTHNSEPTTVNSQPTTYNSQPKNGKSDPTTDNSQPTTPKPTILYIGNQLSARGGSPTSVDVLAPLLREEGFEVKTASAKKNRMLRMAEMLLLVYRNRKTADFVLIDTYSTQNFWYAYAVARFCQSLHLKYIPILHGGDLPERLEKSRGKSEKIFRKAYRIVAPSLYLKSVFQQAGFFNISYIPNSIELQEYPFRERQQLKPNLLWVRSFAEIYNPVLAIESLELLLQDYPQAKLCMVGGKKDDSWKQCLHYAKRHRLPVRFTGKLSKEEWIALAADYDIFLNTTNIDNTPVSVIEAMALGLPVVSTNVGGLPFLIAADLDGLLVPPDDPQRMADAVKKLLKDPARAQERARAARKKIQAFDWKVVKGKWRSVLSSE